MSDKTTQLIHHPYQPPAGFSAPQPGVFKASTVIFPSVAAMHTREWRNKSGYTYGLHGTPTTFMLEERLCALEGGLRCVLACSGLSAIALVNMALLKTGDEMLIPDNVYGPSKALAEGELLAWGISHQRYEAMSPSDLAARINGKTRLVWLEAPGSVTMEFPDLIEMLRICHARGVICALDNTWGAGLAFNAFDLGGESVDISVQALTKYPSGGGDVLMGSIITRDEALHARIQGTHMRMGMGVGGNDAEVVLRSLPSLALRYAAHDRSARALARWFQSRPEVVQVLHPALEGSPGHANWKSVCGGGQAAGVFSVVFHERFSVPEVERFCDSLSLFKLGYSWGGPISLVVPYNVASMRGPAWPYKGVLVRFSTGLEAVDDLQADLAQALDRL